MEFVEFPWGCDYYRKNGRMMDADGFDQLQKFDAIYLGAIGDPSVPDHIVGAGADPAAPAALRSVREPAADAAAAAAFPARSPAARPPTST